MIMRKLILSLMAFALCAGAFAQQSTWFCGTPGAKLSYTRTGAAGTETYQYVVTGIKQDGDKTTITFRTVIPGVENPRDCQVWTEGGFYHMDLNSVMGQYGDPLGATGNAPLVPENPTAGQKLDDCSIEIPGILTTASFSNVRMSRHESVTVPAGTFDCWVLEYATDSKMAIVKSQSRTETWLAKGVGEVKSVTYDKKGKVISTVELTSVE